MTEEQEQSLLARIAEIEGFQAGMSRRLIYARGEAMASTHCLAGFIDLISRGKAIEKASMEDVVINAAAALERRRALSDPKTCAALDHAQLLLKSLHINLRDGRDGPAVMFDSQP